MQSILKIQTQATSQEKIIITVDLQRIKKLTKWIAVFGLVVAYGFSLGYSIIQGLPFTKELSIMGFIVGMIAFMYLLNTKK